jgi:hypothetical protein
MTNSPLEHREHETGPVYSARDMRQGDIVLRKPWERGVFIAGLVGVVVVALVLVLIGVHFGQAYSDQHASGPPTSMGMSKG